MRAAVVVAGTGYKGDAREGISAARELGATDVEIWAIRYIDQELTELPVNAVITIEAAGAPVPERYLETITELRCSCKPDILLFAGGSFADELAAYTGCIAGGSCALSITGAKPGGQNGVIITRRVYGMHLEDELHFTSPPYAFSLARECFSPALEKGSPEIIKCSKSPSDADWYDNGSITFNPKEKSLSDYKVVLVGGRGLGDSATAQKLEELGALLDAGVGGTRPAVYNSWLAYDRMVGLSGNVIKPEVCIVFGASGCTPFSKGVEKSGVLAAVNRDPDALIFRRCDVGVVDDCGDIISELIGFAGG